MTNNIYSLSLTYSSCILLTSDFVRFEGEHPRCLPVLLKTSARQLIILILLSLVPSFLSRIWSDVPICSDTSLSRPGQVQGEPVTGSHAFQLERAQHFQH